MATRQCLNSISKPVGELPALSYRPWPPQPPQNILRALHPSRQRTCRSPQSLVFSRVLSYPLAHPLQNVHPTRRPPVSPDLSYSLVFSRIFSHIPRRTSTQPATPPQFPQISRILSPSLVSSRTSPQNVHNLPPPPPIPPDLSYSLVSSRTPPSTRPPNPCPLPEDQIVSAGIRFLLHCQLQRPAAGDHRLAIPHFRRGTGRLPPLFSYFFGALT